MNFKAFAREVDAVMLYIYGIEWSDTGGEPDLLRREHAEGTTPWKLVLWWGDKYGLTPVHELAGEAAWGVSLDQYRQRHPAKDSSGRTVRPRHIFSLYD